MLRFAPLFSLFLFAPATAAPVPKAKVKDAEAFIGKWNATELLQDGKPSEKDFLGAIATFDKETFTVTVPKQGDDAMTYKLDPSTKWIDLAPKLPGRGNDMKGVYELDGDTLVIALGIGVESLRPKDVKGGPGIVCIKLQRVKEEKK